MILSKSSLYARMIFEAALMAEMRRFEMVRKWIGETGAPPAGPFGERSLPSRKQVRSA
jgi:hypothetical protein